MTFVLTDEQQSLRDTAMYFMSRETPLDYLRQSRDNEYNGKHPELQRKLAESGFFGAIIPDSPGEDHFGVLGMGQILEAQGMTLAATPLLQTALIAVSAIQLTGNREQQAKWLPYIATGDVTVAVAIDEKTHHAPQQVSTTLSVNGDAVVLNGAKSYVADGHHANHILVLCSSEDGLSFVMVPVNTKGLQIQELVTLDSHGAAHLKFNEVAVPESHVLGSTGAADISLQPVLDRACAGLSAEMLGTAQAAYDLTLDYLKERKQFDQILASFQALQHRLSEMFVELELTRSLVTAALSAIDNNQVDASELCSMAKARASDLVHAISNECVQLHGGIGMTDAAYPGFFIKRARVQEAMYGSAGYHQNRIATMHGF